MKWVILVMGSNCRLVWRIISSFFVSFFVLLLTFCDVCFFAAASTETKVITCEYYSASEFNQLYHLRTCWARKKPITSKGFLFTTEPDETVPEVTLSNNKQTLFLPDRLDENFPNLTAYWARSCSIHTITRKNFQNLRRLMLLNLEGNEIKRINFDTFDHLFNLAILNLSEWNGLNDVTIPNFLII